LLRLRATRAVKLTVKRPSPTMLSQLEQTALQLARTAGEHIGSAPSGLTQVHLKKTRAGLAEDADPVSNVDREVECLVRDAISERFPTHAILGEESDVTRNEESPFTWVIDPIDGTTNYLNGLPLYACSIGVLYRHFPVAGAIWCASTHARKSGVYHASEEGHLSFEGEPIVRRTLQCRGVASEPGAPPRYGAFFETRVLAAAAVECAFVASGLLRLAYISAPAIWDVAAGITLARAGGCHVLTKRNNTWVPFSGFTALNARKSLSGLRTWRQPVLIGEARAVDREAALETGLD
jgi:myo-inositol-1(or 4)-monophosphatase